MKEIYLPLTDSMVNKFKIGQEVLLTGTIYTARDIAHRILVDLIKKNKQLPFSLKNQVIYYCGPTPKSPGNIFGACGPTTSSRMDIYTPTLLKSGLKGMIGKGPRAKYVEDAIREFNAVYFITYFGAAAYLTKFIKSAKVIAFKNLGPEAIFQLVVEKFPVIVFLNSK